MMISLIKLGAITATLLPSVLACLGYEGGVPTATSSRTVSAPIRVAAGQTYDAGWARIDRGSGACNSGEGGAYIVHHCIGIAECL